MYAGEHACQKMELQYSVELQCEGNVTSLCIYGVVVLGGSMDHRVCVSGGKGK